MVKFQNIRSRQAKSPTVPNGEFFDEGPKDGSEEKSTSPSQKIRTFRQNRKSRISILGTDDEKIDEEELEGLPSSSSPSSFFLSAGGSIIDPKNFLSNFDTELAAASPREQLNGIRNAFHKIIITVKSDDTMKRKVVVAMVLFLCLILLPAIAPGHTEITDGSSFVLTTNSDDVHTNQDGVIAYACPSLDYYIANSGGENYEEYYAEVTRNMTSDKDVFLATFRETKFDGWDKTYNYVKNRHRDFKTKYYKQYLKEGSTLYESASGIGLNLHMTLEIIAEAPNPISGVTVYGNDYVPESVEKSKQVVLSKGVIPLGNRLGTICPGDSNNLTFVPANAFDVVYCGYVTPSMDNLNLYTDSTNEEWKEYSQICHYVNKRKKKMTSKATLAPTRTTDWMANYLWGLIQEKQRDWYGQWIHEMTRIARPGAPIILESISLPFCDDESDWGGVPESFWYETANKDTYHWNVDPKSVIIEPDLSRKGRYHVVMRKKNTE